MAIETFGFIDDLNAANPTATDNVSEGDDHLRGVKATLKSTFPGITGAVNATQDELNILDGVTATATELNYVDGVTSSIQTQLGNIDTDLLNDTTPQLGGNLDLNSKNITGTGDIPSANLTGALPAISGAALTNLPGGGKLLQVVTYSFESSSTSSTASNVFIDTLLKATITPTSSTSKILIFAQIAAGGTTGREYRFEIAKNSATNIGGYVRVLKDIYGSGQRPLVLNQIDSSPSTSATIYKVRIMAETSGETIYYHYGNESNTITLMEIGA